jgi:hypothetical protein
MSSRTQLVAQGSPRADYLGPLFWLGEIATLSATIGHKLGIDRQIRRSGELALRYPLLSIMA